MKTTISIPDRCHQLLRKLALDRSTTMGELIVDAIRSRYFPAEEKLQPREDGPFVKIPLEGLLDTSTSARELNSLKKIWG